MRYLVILISFLFLGIFSCTKIGKNVTVQGVVKNPITDEPYDGLKVQLLVGETFALPGGFKEIKSTETDQHGKFELSAGRTKTVYVQVYDADGDYRLGWYENGEYTSTSAKEVDKGEVMNVEYHVVPYGELKIHFQNQNCQGPSDTLELYLDGSYVGFDDSQIGKLTTLTGCVDLVDDPIKFPMGERYYHWVVKRGGNVQTFYDTVFLEPNQVTTLDIFY